MLHVPYRGGTAVVNGILTGEIQVGWTGIPNALPLIASGQSRAYCLSILQRSPSTPQIPTCDELGVKGFHVATDLSLYGPAGMSPKIASRLQAEAAKVMREPAISARMQQLGIIMEEDGTASLERLRRDNLERFGVIVRKLKLQVN